MTNPIFLVKQASTAFNEGNFIFALRLWRQAAEVLGEANFHANIVITKKRIKNSEGTNERENARPKLRIAAIMDTFTAACYAPECDLLHLQPGEWKPQIEAFKPDFLFVESAWKGINNLWDQKVSRPDTEVSDLFSWCREKRIPSLFWNKEDPVHFQRFLHIAKQVDYVCTVDYDKIAAYKGFLGHERVFFLPFAAQPTVHNPIEKFTRKDAFCFAGSWYPQYPKRQEDFIRLAGIANKYRRIEIYDRNLGNETFAFPTVFQPFIKGTLPHDDIDTAYKGYKYGINVNTIKNSSTMFARRVYELLASNTIILSNYARGIKTLLGDLILASDSEDFLLYLLKKYTSNEYNYRRFRLLGLRKVMREHTYTNRIAYLCSIMDIQFCEPEINLILLAHVHNYEERHSILTTMELQTWPILGLILQQDFDDSSSLPENVTICRTIEESWSHIEKESLDTLYAILDPRDYYGKHYIEDMALARRYSCAEALGKAAYYTAENGSIQLVNDGKQYCPVERLVASRAMVSRAVITQTWLRKAMENPQEMTPKAISCLALDEFSYIQNGATIDQKDKEIVEDIFVPDQGLPLNDILQQCKIIQGLNFNNKTFSLSGKELGNLVPTISGVTGKEKEDFFSWNSNLKEEFKYSYVQKIFIPKELGIEKNDILLFESEGKLDFSLVFVFLNKNKQKLSHIICKVGQEKNLIFSDDCHFVKLGIRIQGSGEFLLKKVYAKRPLGQAPLLKDTTLVVAKHYPAYNDIYRYGFVHSRLRAYKNHGTCVDFFEFSPKNITAYREYEGINIICGGEVLLDSLLSSRQIKTVCVHLLERPVWEVLKKYVGKFKIIIWCHGAEIQLWKRRKFEFPLMDEPSITKAKAASDARKVLWKEVFQYRKQLDFVFVSDYFKKEVTEDMGLPDDANCHVIHNFIDSEIFSYQKKKAEDRLKIISISNYAALKYANDLSVKAILSLKEKSYFSKMNFTLWGDGNLFDQTVAPLRKFNNISIHKSFLRHEQIALEHKKNGVVLTPTRWDSQGVTRDEAMCSGLVPVTTNIAAVSEFTDNNCAFAVEPESAEALAKAIDKLYRNPELYLAMSKKAAERPRQQCSYANTIARELHLIHEPFCRNKAKYFSEVEYLVYSDTNPNIFDGSSIWLTSVLSILARDHKVATLLKANITAEKHVLQTVEHKENIVFLEPRDFPIQGPLLPIMAAKLLAGLERFCPKVYGVVIRGYEIADILLQRGVYHNKLLPYLSAFYRPGDENGFDIPKSVRPMVRRLLSSSSKVLIQTSFLAEEYGRFLKKPFRWSLLPPAIPDNLEAALHEVKQEEGILHIGYGGKVYPRWGVEELILWTEELIKQGIRLRVHIAMSKIYNATDFIRRMKKLMVLPHVTVYKGLDRTETMSLMRSMDYVWCWREAHFEETTLEISMKLIENTALGKPCICYPSRVNIYFLSKEYPYFCKNKDDFIQLLHRLKSIKLSQHFKISLENFKYSGIHI